MHPRTPSPAHLEEQQGALPWVQGWPAPQEPGGQGEGLGMGEGTPTGEGGAAGEGEGVGDV